MAAVSTEQISELIAPSLRHAQVELVDLQWGRGILRLVVDKPGGVTLDDCERVSVAVSAVLDAYDPIASRYRLEVSSPGAERVLRTEDDWRQALGKNVRVRYSLGDSEITVEGLLSGLSDSEITVVSRRRTRTQDHHISRADVLTARIAVLI